MYEQTYFKAYPEIWNALSVAVTPEQGWRIFMACINNEFTGESDDPLVNAFIKFLFFSAEYDTEV